MLKQILNKRKISWILHTSKEISDTLLPDFKMVSIQSGNSSTSSPHHSMLGYMIFFHVTRVCSPVYNCQRAHTHQTEPKVLLPTCMTISQEFDHYFHLVVVQCSQAEWGKTRAGTYCSLNTLVMKVSNVGGLDNPLGEDKLSQALRSGVCNHHCWSWFSKSGR